MGAEREGAKGTAGVDHEQFAALTRLIAARGSRRGTLLALLGAALFGRDDILIEGGSDAEAKGSGGRDGGKRHGRNRGNGRHRSRRRRGHGHRRKQKDKDKSTCAGIGEEPLPEKPCCQDLVLDGDGRCADAPPPSCAETCDGCCDGETCITDISNAACGWQGSPCVPCNATESCGLCTPGVCGEPEVCIPRTTCVNAECGPQSDGCGGIIQCPGCTAPAICGGGGVPSRCGESVSGPPTCTPRNCTELGVQCGPIGDGCGGLISCGACATGQFCIRNTCRAGTC